ncbi:hypothetical protein ACJIZ3_023974 [Penstemon smallii]|uniref:Uncharacterized protein n=1 Tax=Penstemon smallii TaxID=265156 RepID=A0ABD3TT08_9LAMI
MLNGGLRGQIIVQSLWVLDWQLQNSQLGSADISGPYHMSWLMLCLVFNLDSNGSMIERWTHKPWDCDILSFLKLSLKRRSKELIISILDGVIHMDMEKESVWELIFWSWKEYKAWFGVMEMITELNYWLQKIFLKRRSKYLGVYFLKAMFLSAGNVNDLYKFCNGCKS